MMNRSAQGAPQQKEGLKRQNQNATENEARRVVEGGEADRRSQHQDKNAQSGQQGDNRTPDKIIGQVKYAAGRDKKNDGGADKPQTTDLEPEKQGGIGGP